MILRKREEMGSRALYLYILLAGCVAGAGLWKSMGTHEAAAASSPASYSATWSPQAAAKYMDEREEWWQSWPPAEKDHGTLCISCHTVLPYAMARSALQQELNRAGMPAAEKTMLASVEKRVGDWKDMSPFYSDAVDGAGKTAESHATEAVLNAVILASQDAGQGHLRPLTRTALDEAWALQEQNGGWKWQDFHLAPWESADSGYQGAAMLAVALGSAPEYAEEPGSGKHVEQLREYLKREYAAQPLMSQVYVLWASAHMPGLMTELEKAKLIAELKSQEQSDGGWSLFDLDREEAKNLQSTPTSDGCATGLVVLALEKSGAGSQDGMVERGVEWLEHHQQKDGSWRASSLNEKRDPESDIGRFMSDAATGYAVMALEAAQNRTVKSFQPAEQLPAGAQ